ncbi:hypothetical protein H072_2417 [Dactylellina haptotyla CBS 200.50]|uniref:Mercuric reductase n=1 Tax=Dactylellina haptotyla (strain CBS 200.50) TaxID=1284197 RepID=S8C7B3_DACHA|nr:hypothetical protein H072_2417 [Dactylellina haptotyla CBS 200.50]
MAPRHFKSIILGSGQAAPPLAQALVAAHGKDSTLIIERALIGGTCVNYGCTPTKTMVASGRVAYLSNRGGDYGVATAITTAERGIRELIDMKKIRQRKRDIVTSFRGGSERRLDAAGVEVKYGTGRFVGNKTLAVTPRNGGEEEQFTADNIFINAGCRPAEPKLPGVESVEAARILDSTSIMELEEVPKKLIVVGAGYVGLEFGHLFSRLGAKVTVVGRGVQVLGREDEDIAAEVKQILEQDGMEIALGMDTVRLEKTDEDGMNLKLVYKPTKGGEEISVSGSHLLWSAGRVPNTDLMDLKAGGIDFDEKGFIKYDEYLKTSADGVFVLGDIKGGPAFTHISYDDFRIIKNNFLSPDLPKLTTKDRMVPYTVYTDPQLGHIGVHEHEAKKLYPGRNIGVTKMPMAWVARALETDETRGLMKAIVDRDTEEILGFTCLGIEGGEIMSMIQIAMMGGVKYSQLRDATFAHPTLAESLNNLWGFLE